MCANVFTSRDACCMITHELSAYTIVLHLYLRSLPSNRAYAQVDQTTLSKRLHKVMEPLAFNHHTTLLREDPLCTQ